MHRFDSFQRQFLLSRTSAPVPSNWRTEQVNDWVFQSHPTLSVAPIVSAADTKIGWVLGQHIDLQTGTRAGRSLVLAIEPESDNAAKHHVITQAMRHWAGSYLLIIADGAFNRVYPDVGATMPSVFDTDNAAFGSTAAMLLSPEAFESLTDQSLIAATNVTGDGWLPFGATAHPSIRRLLPNHYFDLDRWSMHRHWPDFTVEISEDTDTAVDRAAGLMRQTADCLSKYWGLTVPLTAGVDSRTVLAGCIGQAEDLETFTLRIESYSADEILAVTMAKECGLSHEVLPAEYTTPEEQAAWHERVGYCSGGSHMRLHRTMENLALERAVLTGLGGEIFRATKWKDSDKPDDVLTPEQLLMRIDQPQHPTLLAGAKAWLATLDGTDALTIMDLLEAEQPVACRVASQLYGPAFVYYDFHLFLQRQITDIGLTLPHDYRRSGQFCRDIVARNWPELSAYPTNSVGGLGDGYILLRKLFDRRRLMRAARKLAS